MLSNLTPAAARALESAQRWAHCHGSAAVQPVHLLLGLLEEEEGRPVLLLSRAGAQLPAIRSALAVFSVGRPDAEANVSLPFSTAAAAILSHARTLAAELAGERAVASEFLLLALVRADATIRRSLEERGLQVAHLEESFRSAQ